MSQFNSTQDCLVLSRNTQGILEARLGKKGFGPVKLIRTFPFSFQNQYVSVRLLSGEEIYLLQTLDSLDEQSRTEAVIELDQNYMIPKILSIISIHRKWSQWVWAVKTDYGEITFQADIVTKISDQCHTVTDLEGRRFEIPDISLLDAHSRKEWAKFN